MDRRRSRVSNRLNGKHRFLITGFSQEERTRLVGLIRQLDGEYIDDRAFREQATHLICQQPNRSEKFLGACATGKWILKCSYLDACLAHGSWLPEDAYEWTDQSPRDSVKNVAVLAAPRRWRRWVAQTESLAFDTWRVILVIDDVNMRQVFRRLLESGGASAVICKLPRSVDRNVTHLFVKTKTLSYEHFKPWKEQGVPCLAPDYIGDYLVADVIPPFNSRDIFLCQKLTDSALKNHASGKRTAVKDMNANNVRRLDLPVLLNSQESHGSFALEEPKSESDSVCSTPAKDVSFSNSGRRYLQVRIPSMENANSGEKKNQVETFKANGKIVRKRVFASSSEDSDNNDVNMDNENKSSENGLRRIPRRPRVNYLKMHCGTITPTDDEKKKTLMINRKPSPAEPMIDDSGLKSDESSPVKTPKRASADNPDPSPRKRRRYNDYVMTFDQQVFLRHRPEKRASFAMSICVEQMFNTCYEEAYYQKALEEFDKYLSVSKYPTAEILWKVMAMLLTSADEKFSDHLYTSLCRLLSLHPPSSAGLQSCYLRAMEYSSNAWSLLMAAVDAYKGVNVDEDLDSAQQAYNSNLLLKFLNAVCVNDLMYCEQSQEKRTPLICRFLWCALDIGSLNSKVRHLISLVVDAISTDDTTLMNVLASLVNCAFNGLQLVAKETRLNCGKSELFIAELTNRLALQHCDLRILERILLNWKDTPLGIGICTAGLDALDNIVFMDRYNDVSLGKILSHYWFSIPKKWTNECDTENVKPTKKKQQVTPLSKAVCVNINKRNVKGETKLHRACIKGDSTWVRQLLTVDGIDVNIQDYAGWSPLHEACNHGHVECVRLLLEYKPTKTLESYFKTKVKKQRKVDLLASDPNEGTTPLHDAVANGRIEVARLLLRHGGRKLLEQTNGEGRTPVDLAVTDTMREVLAESTMEETMDGMNSSQNDCSQLSTQSEDLNEIYEQNGCLTSTLECRRFLMLLETLLTSYIHVYNLSPQCLATLLETDQKYLARLPRYVRKLRRHVEKIVVDGGASQSSELQRILTRLELMAESYE